MLKTLSLFQVMVMFVAIRIERMNIMIMMVTIGHDGDDEV